MKQAQLIEKMTDKEILLNLYITQILMFAFAFIGSLFLFETWTDLFLLFKWQPFQIFVIGGGSAIAIVVFELWLEKVLPKGLFDDGGINERIFRKRSVFHIFFLTTVIAISEELLFRGFLQSNFGIIPASILFAIIHFRYLHKIFLFIITVLLSFYLGWLYLVTSNLLVPIFTHFMIDFVLGCILRFRNQENQV